MVCSLPTTRPAFTRRCIAYLTALSNRMSTHYKWVIMLVVLLVGLISGATIFWFLHRRYHRRREAQWGQASAGSMPNINTWGPNQSVHDLGYTPGASANIEKGKAKEQVRGINEPPPARMRENRLSKF